MECNYFSINCKLIHLGTKIIKNFFYDLGFKCGMLHVRKLACQSPLEYELINILNFIYSMNYKL